jgi:DNA-binding NarL/FixJ family response regulator
MTTIAIVDDQTLVRSGLRSILEKQPDFEIVGEAGDGAAAIEICRVLRPDIVLMDIRMPGLDGLEATRQLLAGPSPAPCILVITTFDLDEYVYKALKAGASGFLLKDASPEQLVAAIRAVAAGDAPLAPQVTRRLIEHYVTRPRPEEGTYPVLNDLTPRETDVLRAVAGGLSNAEIARRLYLSEATVKAHITRLLSKLGVRDRLQAAVFAYESGLVQPGATPDAFAG